MKIDGNQLAQEIFEDLKKRVGELKKNGTTPHLAIILVGDDPASVSYVRQKEIKAQAVGALATVYNLPLTIDQDELISKIMQLNNDKNVHGIIVQRPLPFHIDSNVINEATSPQKDIDSFHSASPYPMPIASAVLYILNDIFTRKLLAQGVSLIEWLKTKNTVIIGKGETGGKPVLKTLQELGIEPTIIDSKTPKPEEITKQADIIISAVGKPNIIKPQNIKKGVILLSLGIYKGEDGKLHGDYEEDDIKDNASFYTPTPGGVGPVNVAMLLENLLNAAELAENPQNK